MTSHKSHRWPLCPDSGKRRYRTRKDAAAAVQHAVHVRVRAELDGAVATNRIHRFYVCASCRGYHTTSKPDRSTVAASAVATPPAGLYLLTEMHTAAEVSVTRRLTTQAAMRRLTASSMLAGVAS